MFGAENSLYTITFKSSPGDKNHFLNMQSWDCFDVTLITAQAQKMISQLNPFFISSQRFEGNS